MINDHNYTSTDQEEEFLKAFGLVTITEEEIIRIETSTKKDKNSWKEERSKRMCFSSFGNLCKFTDKTDTKKLCTRLMNTQDLYAAPILHGKKYERAAVQMYD